MNICCGVCHGELAEEDVIIMDVLNGLSHFGCYSLGANLINDIGLYRTIKEKYSFFHDDLL